MEATSAENQAAQQNTTTVQMSASAAEAVKSTSQLAFQDHSANGWHCYWSSYPMSNSREMEAAQDKIATMGLPEVFYGNNHLYMAKPENNFLLEISPVDSLSYSSFVKRQEYLRGPEQASVEVSFGSPDTVLNLIDMVPRNIQVREAAVWQNKDTSKIVDFSEVDVFSDWTYSTPYKASLRFLSTKAEEIKNQTALDIPAAGQASAEAKIKVEVTDQKIPYERLGQENPIVQSGQIYLFECDLEDSGYTLGQCRFRFMNDCWYILLRSYIRVDGVCVRVLDTRIFHDYATREILREFTHREATYDELRQQGFPLSSEWMLSQTQADEVAPITPIRMQVTDRITF